MGAAVATAHGLFEVAVAARVPVGIAWLYPLITDGLALVAYAATARLHGDAVRYAWSVVIGAAGLSGLAQAAYLAGDADLHAAPALRFGVGAWPAIAAAVVAHLLYLLADGAPDPTERPDGESVATTEPADFPPALSDGQPDVHPALDTPKRVRIAVYDAVAADLGGRTAADAGEQPGVADEHPDGASSPRERARVAALQHAAGHGALPTVSELQGLADVSRGTAGAVLKILRQRPQPLHLVADTPDPETQP